jgi:NADH-quinone oxidoreductase subunit G
MATIEIDGQAVEVENGKMIIEVADELGIYIPRFCYHKKLSVAANCRMCLVEVDNSKKTVPACATPINNGMKVFTKSKNAIKSQKAVMSFLLVNHPLDCPICDQGGECELQDLSMGFGEGYSDYQEAKRAVHDDNLGSLIATHMTRCIHCTRCVRFGKEIAGIPELGGIGRGEHMRISTYVDHSMQSEVSGNIIDLCPVGALTAKPSQFTARAFEMTEHSGVAVHDCLGSNIKIHTMHDKVVRVIPAENDKINETWLSDRDRFGYLGLNNHASRIAEPMIKRNGQWEVVDWETALSFAATGIRRVISQHGADEVAAFAHPSSSLEEMYLLQKMMRVMEVHNIDHRLQQTDFSDDAYHNLMPTGTLPYAELENQKNILLFGCNVQREVPLAAIKIRKAQTNGAKVFAINPVKYDFCFEVDNYSVVGPDEMILQLAKILLAVSKGKSLPESIKNLLVGLKVDAVTNEIAKNLDSAVIVFGALVDNHPHAALLRALLHFVVEYSNAKTIHLTVGANVSGAYVAGLLPHRGVFGAVPAKIGLNVKEAIEKKLKAYVLLGAEPGLDFANPADVRKALLSADFVVSLAAFQDESAQDYADVILPIAPFAETSGTYINLDGSWQSMQGAVKPYSNSRPAWKILRVLANFMHCEGFIFESSLDVLMEVKSFGIDVNLVPRQYEDYPAVLPALTGDLVRVGEWPLYRTDAIVRNSLALQKCAAADAVCIKMHPETCEKLKLSDRATISQGNIEITLSLCRDENVARDVVWVANAMLETSDLGSAFASITVKSA